MCQKSSAVFRPDQVCSALWKNLLILIIEAGNFPFLQDGVITIITPGTGIKLLHDIRPETARICGSSQVNIIYRSADQQLS